MSTPQMWSWKLSPFAGKARIALAVKQIEVELLEIDPAARQPGLRAVNTRCQMSCPMRSPKV